MPDQQLNTVFPGGIMKRSNLCVLLPLLAGFALYGQDLHEWGVTGANGGAPAISAVVNAASNIPQGLPNAGIAQGAMFVVYGSNLGPAAISYSSAPFHSASQAGTSIAVSIGGQTVNALMYYSAAGQVAALLPSDTPLGTGSVVLTYNGVPSAAFPVTVVQNNLGIFTVSSDGKGVGIVTFPDYSLVSTAKAANPGDTLILWGTGLGPVNGSDAAGAGLGVNMTSVPLKLWLGGVQASVTYKGRTGCCVGEDEVVFTVPSNVPIGCAVTLVAQIGNEISNNAVIPVANGSRTCTPINSMLTPSVRQALSGSAPLTYAQINLERRVNDTGTGYVDTGDGQFAKVSVSPALQPFMVSYMDIAPVGTCQSYNNLDSWNQPPFASAAGADAGASLNVTGPAGTQSLPLAPGSVPTDYNGTLSAAGTYLSPGEYTVTGSGGANVGPFTVKFNIPISPVWSNQSSLANVTRANGLTFTWSGGTANNWVYVGGLSATDSTHTNGASFGCLVEGSAGAVTVPPAVLLALPAGNYGTLQFEPTIFPVGFTASGLTFGSAIANLKTVISTVFQ
jgi:uncharacterized protein (TIGR03437 family)